MFEIQSFHFTKSFSSEVLSTQSSHCPAWDLGHLAPLLGRFSDEWSCESPKFTCAEALTSGAMTKAVKEHQMGIPKLHSEYREAAVSYIVTKKNVSQCNCLCCEEVGYFELYSFKMSCYV